MMLSDGPQALQRDQAHDRRHLAADADADAARAGARRPGHANGLPDDSAARRLRADRSRPRPVEAGEGARQMGDRASDEIESARGRNFDGRNEARSARSATPARRRGARAGPASSSSAAPVRTIAGEAPDIRIRSSNDRARPQQTDDAPAVARSGVEIAARHRARVRRTIGRSMIGVTALMTSAASVVSVAPCLIRSLVPAARGSSGEPGTAKTSRPCSAAIRAVISEPERCAASTTTTPSAAPGDQPVAAGEIRARGTWPSGISEIAPPCSSSAASKSSCSGG